MITPPYDGYLEDIKTSFIAKGRIRPYMAPTSSSAGYIAFDRRFYH